MQTEKVPLKESLNLPSHILNLRNMSEDEFIQTLGSGTLRDAKEFGCAYSQLYRHERVCFEYGSGFEILPSTRIMFNILNAEGDCPPVREAIYSAKRAIRSRIFLEDYYELKYINITESDGTVREGAGLILRETTSPWIPSGNIVFCIVAEYDTKTKQWKEAVNPF